jgi:hypothetical protein
LENIVFENDYGVDIGLLIDMYQANARIAEVNIGYVENKMKPLQSLGNMAKEVTRAIMNRAEADTTYHAVPHQSVIGGLRAELNPALKHKVVVFDMDRQFYRIVLFKLRHAILVLKKPFGKLPLSMSTLSLEPRRLPN